MGETVQFMGTAVPARGKEIFWMLSTDYIDEIELRDFPIEQRSDLVTGESASLSITFTEGDVGNG